MKEKKLKTKLTGRKFLRSIHRFETACASTTARQLPKMGKKGTECYEILGMVLALTDCAASCYWGCAGGDHRLEYLIGRATNSAYAALSAATRGYYDQALSGARTLGEIANLLALFAADRAKIDEWKGADERTRKQVFGPVKVRLALEALGAPVPVDEKRYGRLSTFSIHQIPDALPQVHNPHGKAITFPAYQMAGFLMALNEIAIPVAFIAVFASTLLKMETGTGKTFRDIGQALIKSVGGIAVTVEGRPWFKLN